MTPLFGHFYLKFGCCPVWEWSPVVASVVKTSGRIRANFSKLTEKGCPKVNQINTVVNAKPGLKVHKKCRLDLLRPRGKSSDTKCEENVRSVKRRSIQLSFSLPEHCLFCGQPKYDG